jgi:hypothetical protein
MSIETNYSAANLRLTYELEVDGFKWRYYSHEAPASVANFTQARAILEISDSSSRLDLVDGIAETGSVTVRLQYAGNTSGLLRVGQRGATSATYLAAEIESAAAGTNEIITVDDSSWVSVGDTIWIGQEALYVNSVPTGTTIDVDRGHLLSETQWHRIDTETQTRPIVTSECVAFRTRRCRLRAYRVRGTAVDSTGIDIIRGFIDETPRLSDDGLTIEVTIAPDSARLQQKLPSEQGAASAGLVHGEHYFTGSSAGVTLFYEVPDGAAFAGTSPSAANRDARTFEPGIDADEAGQVTDIIDAMFDTAWGTEDDRSGRVVFKNHGKNRPITNIDTANDEITVDGGIFLLNTFKFKNPTLGHSKSSTWYDGTAASLELWPQVMLEVWNADLRPSSIAQADDGAFADVTLGPAAVRVVGNAAFDEIRVTLPARPYADWGNGADAAATFSVGGENEEDASIGAAFSTSGIATGFYQSGETQILLSDNLAGSGSLPMWVRIDAYVPAVQAVATQVVQVTAITSQALSSGDTGYRYTIEPFTAFAWESTDVDIITDRAYYAGAFPLSFCDFDYLSPDERCKVTPILMTGESADLPGTVLELLQSKYGDGVRGTSDVLTDGLGLVSNSQVDPTTFDRATTPPGLDQTAFVFDEESSVHDIIGPMLRAAGYALTPRLSLANGRRLLSLVPMRRASAVQSRLALTRDDFISEPSVASITDDEVVNRITYQAPGDSGIRVEFRDVDSIGRNGERRTQDEELIGFVPTGDTIGNAAATMQPIALRRFALVGTPRRVIRGSVRLGLGLLVDPGDVITLTHSDALDYTGGRGLSSAPMLVVAVRRDFESATAELDLVYHGANLSGFAPSLTVTDHTISATTVEVAANDYTQAVDPVNGEAIEDLSYWAAGDVALVVSDPLGAGWPAGYTLTVDSVDLATNRITFTGAHAGTGLTTGSILRPASYTSASAAHQAFAYLSDGDEIAAGVVTLEHD